MAGRPPGLPKTGGRRKGIPNKMTALLKDAVVEAARRAGRKINPEDRDGLISYLEQQAEANPGPFLTLLGKVLPLQVTGDGGGPAVFVIRDLTRSDNE